MSTDIVISSPESPLNVVADAQTGLPTRIRIPGAHLDQHLRVGVSATVDGVEGRGWTGGIRYDNTETYPLITLDAESPRRTHRGTSDEYAVTGSLGDLSVRVMYRLYPTAPYLELVVQLAASREVLVRNLRVTIDVVGDPSVQQLFTPGNAIHRGLVVHELGVEPFGISPLGGLRGASGIVSIVSNGTATTVWPNQSAEIPDIVAHAIEDGLRLEIDTNFAAAVGPDNSAELMLATFDLQTGGLDMLKEQWPDWASRYALTTPPVKPEWVGNSSIYEVQIGTSYFWGGNSYCRYSEIADLIADIERIQSLGFAVIQMMPQQPYPSYNVHDYADISTSYGDEKQLVELVRVAHSRGMRVILDVLLHGVLDNESMDMAIEGIKEGPLASRLDEETGDSFGTDLSDPTNYYIAWSRHILDFAEYWKGGSPERSPLLDEHPEWFFRDSSGSVTGVYTKAFDARHPLWQRYFRDAMMHLVTTLDIDGFRFDAPTYNNYANWSDWARARASLSPLGCIPLFVDLRRDLKGLKREALMYTEPSGHLLRRSMDLNYNYDEQWLVTALATPTKVASRGVTSAREFMQWIEDRDAFLPLGAQTAHHIDSHDTFWWPQWGKKWRREQFGVEKVRALACTFLALDGPYMMFTGGEEGIEQELRLLNGLRRDRSEFWRKPARFDDESDHSGDLFIALRDGGTADLVVIVNITGDGSRTVPAEYSDESWVALGSSGYVSGELEANGYLVAVRGV